MGSSSKSSKQTVKKTPYGPVTPVLKQGSSIMSQYLSNPASTAVYEGPRVADLSSDTQAGIQGLRDSTGANASQDYLMGLLNTPGNVADNPQVQALQDAIRRQVQATSNATFSGAGTVGGTAHQESLAKGLADGLAQPLFQAYENDQARKLAAAGQLPGVGQQIITNQLGAGQILDSNAQAKINAALQKFEEERTAPIRAWTEVAPLATQIGGMFGTTNSKTKTKEDPSLGSQIMGGVMTGAGLLSGMPTGMFGTSGGNVALAPWTATVIPGMGA